MLLDPADWQGWLLVFSRLTAFLAVGPLFALRGLPPLARAGLGALLALLIWPAVSQGGLVPRAAGAGEWVLLAAGEALVGLTLGYASSLVLEAVRLAGAIVDLETGLAMADLLDPQSGVGNTVLAQYLYLLGLVVFLEVDGHHGLLAALADSFRVVPLGTGEFSGVLTQHLLGLFAGMFTLAVRLAAPVVAILVVSDVALALVARTVPQLNVFMLGFPLKSGLALVSLALALPLMAAVWAPLFTQIGRDLATVSATLRGGP